MSVRVEKNSSTHGQREVAWTTYTPDNTDSINPEQHLVAPGFLARQALYKPLAMALAEKGNRVTLVGHESGGERESVSELVYVSKELQDVYQQPIALDAHSMGGMHGIQLMYENPGLIQNAILLQPAGFGGVQSHMALLSVLTKERVGLALVRELPVAVDALGYIAKSRHHLMQTAQYAATGNIISRAKEVASSTPTTALLFEDDRLISSEKARRGLAAAGIDSYYLDVPRPCHNAHRFHPQAVASDIESIIRQQSATSARAV